ncbi:galactokinase [Bacillus sp. FJAT-27986]|nr:galactokinase [Bacillus sp. FJAT-27986]
MNDKVRTFFSPGRINLIGEHTDYNGGYVFPSAITYGTYGLVRLRGDRTIRLYSLNFKEVGIIEFSLDDLDYDPSHQWANYPKGVLRYIAENGNNLPNGLDILIYGNIPNGAGLSSSASLEVLIGVMVNEVFQLKIDRIELVKIGQKVENQFIGVNSGIMDQFAIGMGKAKSAILLDCQTLSYEYAPFDIADHQIVIMNTNKRRELADSKYNERRSECEAALARLQTATDISSLGELSIDLFDQHKAVIADSTLEKRARHAVYENERTKKAFQALQDGNLVQFGIYMNESHISLRDDYEVTGPELDALVEAAWQQEGTVGSRMTGAGFGGCAIALVQSAHIERFIQEVGDAYKQTIGYEADFYVASIGDGTKEIITEAIV